tara:strand:- start:1378 stop:1500 length:123 start_codon:yes stop_codon:yes gene_type:complete
MSDSKLLDWLVEKLQTYSVMSEEDITELLLELETLKLGRK